MLWIQFVVSALVIILAGSRLSRYGDIIAEKTGLGGSLVVVESAFLNSTDGCYDDNPRASRVHVVYLHFLQKQSNA